MLAFWSLGQNDFWDDEANTAVLGRNFMKTGKVIGWDGRNLLSYGIMGSMDEDMMKRSVPPLQCVVAGLSLKAFGDNTAGARFLFVLIGLFSIPLIAAWFRHEFDSDRYWVVALILAVSVPYLLYLRQVRYYSLGLTFAAGLLWVWAALRHAKHYRRWILLGALFLCLLILSQYLYAAGTLAVIGLSMIRERYRNRKNVIFLAVIAFLGLVAVTWIALYSLPTLGRAFDSARAENLMKFVRLMWMVPRDAVRFEFFPVGMLIFAVAGLTILGKNGIVQLRNILLTAAYMLAVIIVISFLSPQPVWPWTSDADMRYYVLLIPLSAAVAAQVYEILSETRFRGLPELFLIILMSSNVLTFNFLGPIGFRSRPVQYLGEVMNDYTTGSEAISRYIDEHIPRDKCIFLVPMHLNIIQMYYHPEHKFCGLVSNQAPFARKHARTLREDLFWENAIPDYFIVGGRPADQFSQFLAKLYGEGGYELAAVLPIFWANLTRPEIPWRTFAPIPIADPFSQGVLVFQRTSKPAHRPKISAVEVERLLK
ncbi:glycosyltransferase family 39 protein, partial [Acidobacteria bacterium AH-259-L09]|nr:glycosyltransferase family 39 protein [Acidobacteria bacterium AH-259-L09]